MSLDNLQSSHSAIASYFGMVDRWRSLTTSRVDMFLDEESIADWTLSIISLDPRFDSWFSNATEYTLKTALAMEGLS